MSDFRILGRDSTMRLTQDGVLLSETTALKNIDFKPMQTLISEGFLGEAAKRHREIVDEVDISWSVEPEGSQILQMQYAIYNRARSGTGNMVINVGFRLAFPSGKIVRITVPDIKFSANGDLSVPGRESFDTMSFAGKAQKYIPNFG
jgi:hypothetical protein